MVDLWCYIKDNGDAFRVSVPPHRAIDDLKEVNVNYDEVKERIKTGQYQPAPNDQVLKSMNIISNIWKQPRSDEIHVFVSVPDRPTRSVSQPSNLLYSSLRSTTVSALYERLKMYSFILVRGTPASGKTSLSFLLKNYIHEQESGVDVIMVFGWPQEKVDRCGGWNLFLQKTNNWEPGKKPIFIFDEAQESYGDTELWDQFIKDFRGFGVLFIIAFASYGSPTSEDSPSYSSPASSIDSKHPPVRHTPVFVSDPQRVTLRPIDHQDGLHPVGLLFTEAEFNDLLQNQFPSNEYYFHPTFLRGVFDFTGGHVGAIIDFLKIIVCHDSYRQLKRTGESYSWNSFLESVNLHELVKLFEKSSSNFIRGLPRERTLQRVEIARVFSEVLRNGAVTVNPELAIEDRGLRRCFHRGWLHADKVSTDDVEETGFIFSSPFHRWFVEWKLYNKTPRNPFETRSILQLVLDVIAKFSPRLLSAERRIGPGCIQRPPEAQYQDEFYRSCHAISDGSLMTFPEFGTGKGRVDFYIPSRRWGVELLRDGDRLDQHHGRFSNLGSYGTTLALDDYIVLDCRNTVPRYPHGDMRKLYHAVFSNGHQEVSVLDHSLQLVRGGKLRLLASA